jgi:hypothetical protein|tara:strand:- start:418 stop:729 length:312 start_codon:yes stop_codon:yes gene_type:complete
MKGVYKVIADTENMIQRKGWRDIVTWGPLQYDSQDCQNTLFPTKESAERFAERKNNNVVELVAQRINVLTGIKQGKGATEFRMCVNALKEKPYRVEFIRLSEH